MNQVAFVFPGQGAQSAEMFDRIGLRHVESLCAEAEDAIGVNLLELQHDGQALAQTEITQPALLTASVACYRMWKSQCPSVEISALAGHSLGEYSALVCADVMSFHEAVKLVALRGRLMQTAVPLDAGAMAVVLGLDDDVVVDICEEVDGIVEAVNFNTPGQVVIAGYRDPIESALAAAKEQGAKRAMLLPVSVPSHCQLMVPMADEFAQALCEIEIQMPQIPLWHNATLSTSTNLDELRQALVDQLTHPVRWTDLMRTLEGNGINHFIECGSGRVLTGLNKRIVPESTCANIMDMDSLTTVCQLLKEECIND